MMSSEAQRKYRENLVQHGEDLKALLDSADPQVAMFLRVNFQLNLYPLEFTRDWISKLTQFKDAVIADALEKGEAPKGGEE